MLIFLSDGYFSSINALRELRAMCQQRKPYLIVRERDPAKGAISLHRGRRRIQTQS